MNLKNRENPTIILKPEFFQKHILNSVLLYSIFSTVILIMFYLKKINIETIGSAAVLFSLVQFGAPLLTVGNVIKQGFIGILIDIQYSLLLLSAGVSWSIYGILITDFNLYFPNLIGSLLSLLQVTLFLFFPVKPQAGLDMLP